jgi:hypothetical protein
LVISGYIARQYSPRHKILGQPAVYYLLPKAFSPLKKIDIVSSQALKNMYKNHASSERFINHSLNIYKAYTALKACYGQKLWFFTSNDLKLPKYEYFPNPLPDSFLSIKLSSSPNGKRKHYFLAICSSNVPLFVHLKLLKTLTEYRYGGEWEQTTNTSLSAVLILTDTAQFQRRLIEKMSRFLYGEGLGEDISYFITNQSKLAHISAESNDIWQSISKPTVMKALEKI